MHAELVKTFEFAAAHSLDCAPDGHKCRGLHGHTYKVDIHVTGPVNPKHGWVIDFGMLKDIVAPVIDSLDHKNLNEIEGLEQTTSEMLAKYIWDRVKPAMPLLSTVTIWESPSSRCIYKGQ